MLQTIFKYHTQEKLKFNIVRKKKYMHLYYFIIFYLKSKFYF